MGDLSITDLDMNSLSDHEFKQVYGLVNSIAVKRATRKLAEYGDTPPLNVINIILGEKFRRDTPLDVLKTMAVQYGLGQGVENADSLWYRLPLTKVFRDTVGDTVTYSFLLETTEIRLGAEDLSKAAAVAEHIFEHTGIALPNPSSKAWNLFRMYLTAIAETRHNLASLESEEDRMREITKNYIETAVLTDSYDAALRFGYIILEDGVLRVYNKHLQQAVENHIGGMSSKKIAKALEDVMIASDPIRVGKKIYRFWSFRQNAYNLNSPVVSDSDAPSPSSPSIKPQPKALELKGNIVICPSCGTKTAQMWDYAGQWLCLDCLKIQQDKNTEEPT